METTITILVDNTAKGRGFIAEHGFAAWIARGHEHILFDTGAGNALPVNLKRLKKDVRDLDCVILSHGHWDHTGGLQWVLQARESTDIFAHSGIFVERYSTKKHEKYTEYVDASIPFSREELEQAGARFHLAQDYLEISDGMWFSGEIPRPSNWTSADQGLFIKQGEQYLPDPLVDDASLLLNTSSGPVVLLGCAHAGVDIILDYLSTRSGHTSFHAVIGGFHLAKAGRQRVVRIIESLEHYQVQHIIAAHCTGFSAMAELYQHFPTRFKTAHTGAAFSY